MAKINLQDGELARMQITKEQEVEISKLYHQTYLDLKKEMEKLSHSGTTSESLQKTYLNKLVKQLKEAYKSNGEGLEKQIQKGMLDTAQAVVDNNSDWLKKAGLKIEGAYSYVPQDIVSLLSTGKLYGKGWSLSKAIWGDSQKKAHDIDQIVASGVAANKSAYEIAKDLEKYVNPDAKKEWDWSKVYPGTSKKVDYNAQRLARTMVSHAYQQSLLATTKYNPFVKGYKWRSAHTHRTCELCNERDGQVYSANDLPLDHPNGLCTFLVELEGSLEDVANRLGDWANGAEDPALDKWANSMFPKAGSKSSPPQKVKDSIVKSSPTKTETPSKNVAFPFKDWMSKIEKNTESEMLDWESRGLMKLPQSQLKALQRYTGSGYAKMNSYLRYVSSGESEEWAIKRTGISSSQLKDIEKARGGLKSLKTTESLYLRRGTDLGDLAGLLPGSFYDNMSKLSNMSVEELNQELSGVVGTYSGFTSTSSLWDRGFSGDVEVIFHAPPGTSASSIMSISKYGTEEGETLLNAGTTVRIDSIEKSDGHKSSKIRVFMEIIP